MQTAPIVLPERRAFLGMSHSPLLGLNSLHASVQAELDNAIARARMAVRAFDPQMVVLVGPDHYNGFFNELMPPFCIGTAATAVGDYLTPAGPMAVDESAALELASHLMDNGFDIAVSRRMRVDHGFSQALQFIWDGLDTPPVVPIFMNAVADPGIPRLRRCLQLGREIGRYLDTTSVRTLLIGSGGLSHEPPVPTLTNPDPAVRERITARQDPTPEEREAKTRRVMAAGMALAGGDPGMKPLNPEWDKLWMDAMESDDLESLTTLSEQSITDLAGLSAHESKTWLIARAAMPKFSQAECSLRHYQAIPELIAGYGLMFLQTQ